MQLFKLITGGLILALIGLFIYQNLSTFNTFLQFSLDLYIREKVVWSHHLYTLLLFSALLGFIVGLVLMLRPYFNIRRQLSQERQEKEQLRAQQPPVLPEKQETVERAEGQ